MHSKKQHPPPTPIRRPGVVAAKRSMLSAEGAAYLQGLRDRKREAEVT